MLITVSARWRPVMRAVVVVVAFALLLGAVLVGFLLAGAPPPGREDTPRVRRPHSATRAPSIPPR